MPEAPSQHGDDAQSYQPLSVGRNSRLRAAPAHQRGMMIVMTTSRECTTISAPPLPRFLDAALRRHFIGHHEASRRWCRDAGQMHIAFPTVFRRAAKSEQQETMMAAANLPPLAPHRRSG